MAELRNFTFIARGVELSADKYSTDKNGMLPVLLDVLAGEAPINRTLSGTVAEREKILPQTTYVIECEEREEKYEGRSQFNFKVVGKLTTMEYILAKKEFGAAKLIDTDATSKKEEAEEMEYEEDVTVKGKRK